MLFQVILTILLQKKLVKSNMMLKIQLHKTQKDHLLLLLEIYAKLILVDAWLLLISEAQYFLFFFLITPKRLKCVKWCKPVLNSSLHASPMDVICGDWLINHVICFNSHYSNKEWDGENTRLLSSAPATKAS